MKRILVVDDMSQWRNFHKNALKSVLQNIDYELTINHSATEAYQTIQEQLNEPFDLIITDLQMEEDYEPEHAGEWLVRNTKTHRQYFNRPIIIVSAAYNIKFIADNLGVDFLPKPTLINNPLSYQLKITELLNC